MVHERPDTDEKDVYVYLKSSQKTIVKLYQKTPKKQPKNNCQIVSKNNQKTAQKIVKGDHDHRVWPTDSSLHNGKGDSAFSNRIIDFIFILLDTFHIASQIFHRS